MKKSVSFGLLGLVVFSVLGFAYAQTSGGGTSAGAETPEEKPQDCDCKSIDNKIEGCSLWCVANELDNVNVKEIDFSKLNQEAYNKILNNQQKLLEFGNLRGNGVVLSSSVKEGVTFSNNGDITHKGQVFNLEDKSRFPIGTKFEIGEINKIDYLSGSKVDGSFLDQGKFDITAGGGNGEAKINYKGTDYSLSRSVVEGSSANLKITDGVLELAPGAKLIYQPQGSPTPWTVENLAKDKYLTIQGSGEYSFNVVNGEASVRTVKDSLVQVDHASGTNLFANGDGGQIGRPSFSWETLQRGSKGRSVGEAQAVLDNLGYPTDRDLKFGLLTKESVIKFQEDHVKDYGLKIDGILGPNTRAAMEAEYVKNFGENSYTLISENAIKTFKTTDNNYLFVSDSKNSIVDPKKGGTISSEDGKKAYSNNDVNREVAAPNAKETDGSVYFEKSGKPPLSAGANLNPSGFDANGRQKFQVSDPKVSGGKPFELIDTGLKDTDPQRRSVLLSPEMTKVLDDLHGSGYSFKVDSAWRSSEYQDYLKSNIKNTPVADGGASLHQTGFALDVKVYYNGHLLSRQELKPILDKFGLRNDIPNDPRHIYLPTTAVATRIPTRE